MSEDLKTLAEQGAKLRERLGARTTFDTPATEKTVALGFLLLENRLARIHRILEANAQEGK